MVGKTTLNSIISFNYEFANEFGFIKTQESRGQSLKEILLEGAVDDSNSRTQYNTTL